MLGILPPPPWKSYEKWTLEVQVCPLGPLLKWLRTRSSEPQTGQALANLDAKGVSKTSFDSSQPRLEPWKHLENLTAQVKPLWEWLNCMAQLGVL